eukprot:764300-Hanusia_phi.AAC.5
MRAKTRTRRTRARTRWWSSPDSAHRSHFKGLHDQKVCILGLTSILKVPLANLPPSVSSGLSHILKAILELQEVSAAAAAAVLDLATNKKLKEENANHQGGDDDDEDDVRVKRRRRRRRRRRKRRRRKYNGTRQEDGVLDVDDEEDEFKEGADMDSVLMKLYNFREGGCAWEDLFPDDDDDDDEYISPIDDVRKRGARG